VNHREFQNFFTTEQLRMNVRRPLVLTETGERSTCSPRSQAAARHGQAGRVRLGIARALVVLRPRAAQGTEEGRAPDVGFARQGTEEVRLAGARKRFQFSKR
jgi:small subunit ribosomal protein S9